MKARRALTLLAAIALLAGALLACNREKELRNKECGDFAEWSNHVGDPLGNAVPEAEKSAAAAHSHEQQAAVYRRLAEGARTSAQASIPFTDPYVKDLAARRLKVFDGVAIALDHQADAWAKGDNEAVNRGLLEEMDAKKGAGAIASEWLNKCRL